MENKIVEVINALSEKFGIAIDWSEENLVPYLQQLCDKYIAFEIWSSIFWIVVVSFCFAICLILTLCVFVPWAKRDEWCEDASYFGATFSIVVTAIVGVITVVVIGVQVYDIIICNVFPEKMILEYAKELLTINA